jgi:hypothetical protein
MRSVGGYSSGRNIFNSAEFSAEVISVGGVTSCQEFCMGNIALMWARKSTSSIAKEREQQSASVLVAPGVYSGDKAKGDARRWRASRCKMYAGAATDMVEPLRTQETAATLSEAKSIVGCEMGVCMAAREPPRTISANSRSLLVSVPVGLSVLTRFWLVLGWKA